MPRFRSTRKPFVAVVIVDDELAEHMVHVYRFSLRLTAAQVDLAEEVTQETMLKALRRLDGLANPEKMRVWLLKIATNVWRDMCRKRTRSVCHPLGSDESLAEPAPGPLQQVLINEELSLCMAALDGLPERQRSVLYLTACEGLSGAEVAEVNDISVQAVKTSLSIARAKMRRMAQQRRIGESERFSSSGPTGVVKRDH